MTIKKGKCYNKIDIIRQGVNKMKRKIEIIIVLIIVISTALSIQYIVDAVQYVQYIRSGINAFPTDYRAN